MKHLAPIRMFGPGKGDFKSADPDHPDSRDFRADVEKLDDDADDPEGAQDPVVSESTDSATAAEITSDSTQGTEGSAQGALSAVPKD